ncbi:MAG: UvrD-helicase domain-containing protein [Polyangiaceae bacterium]|nr:UvrD-helicase domain-containing protein [Polyangiaceae bacterium]
MVVFAGAGSGKTRVITYRIANLLATHRVPPYRLLAVTFTNKAAGEMKRRLENLVGPELVRDLWVGTFHATCARLLRRHYEAAGLGKNFIVYDDDDQRAVMTRVYKDLRIDDKRHPMRQVMGRIQREKQDGLLAADFIPSNPIEAVVSRCFSAYEERLMAANAVDFDDLLIRVLRIVEDQQSSAGAELRRKFVHVLVDEFQDVNRVQYRLVRGLSHKTHNLFVVGDDDQSIYRWRGADVTIVRNFRKDHPDAKIVKLEQNYRSSANVVAAALGVIKPAADREPKELWTDNVPGDHVDVVACASERDEAAFVAERIRELMDAGVSPAEIAVFYRVHAQSRVLEEVLRSERIPYQVIGGVRFFERAEVKDLVSYLRVVSNPKSDVDLVRIINVPSRKIGDTTVEKLAAMASELGVSMFEAIEPLVRSDRLGTPAKKALAVFHTLMAQFTTIADTASPRELAERILAETGYVAMLEAQGTDEAEGRLLNLQELVGSIEEYEREALAAEEVPNIAGYLEKVALVAVTDELKDAPRVAMMTVHAAKGLEFSFVFLTGMEEDMFPFRSQDPSRSGDIEEERRLAYVAITRARLKLWILHAERRMVFGGTKYGMASRFIADLPRDVIAEKRTEVLRASAGRFIDRDGWGASSRSEPTRPGAAGAQGRLAWSHPQAGPAGGGATRPVTASGRSFEPGERYVERDDDAAPQGFRRRMPPDAPRPGGMVVGAKVEHKTFGIGVILEVDNAPDATATVKFSGWSPKRIKVRFLEIVREIG